MKYLKCNCGREQAYGRPHFITIKEAESLGWVLIEHQWVCPVCNPALAKILLEVFVQNRSGNRVSCGKYETLIENYVLCVDVRHLDLSDLLYIHIEFSGKVRTQPALAKKAINSLKVTCNDTREKDS